MLKLGPIAYFNHNLLKWDEDVVLMKEPGHFLGKPYLSKKDMQEVQINTVYPGFTKESTDRIIKILHSTYKRDGIGKVSSNTTQ